LCKLVVPDFCAPMIKKFGKGFFMMLNIFFLHIGQWLLM
jgi:hypothetical protein